MSGVGGAILRGVGESMLRLCILTLAILLAIGTALNAETTDVSCSARNIGGISCLLVEIPMAGKKYRVDVEVAKNFPGTQESFSDMVSRVSPIAAINGTFFGKNNLIPIGDIVKDGKLIHFGGIGTAVCLTKNNDVEFVDVPMWTHMDWSRYLTVVAAGPRLITNGKITVNARAQGFSDPNVLGKATRVAIGMTQDGRMLWVLIKNAVSLEKCAEIMLLLGCVNAMNSDGGSSQALYYRGETKVAAGRALTNIMYVRPYLTGGATSLSQISGGAFEGESADQHFMRAQAFAFKQAWNSAIKEYKIATNLDPNQAAYYNALAKAYSAIGNQDDQSKALRQSGKIYIAKGIYDVAIVKLVLALKLVPTDPEIYRSLALAYEGLGDTANAAKMLKEAEKYSFASSSAPSPQSIGYKGLDFYNPEPESEPSDEVASGNPPEDGEWRDFYEEDDNGGDFTYLEPDFPEDDPPFATFDGEMSEGRYYERNLGFTLLWLAGWDAEVDADKRLIILSHESGPFYGTLQTFWVGENETLDGFEQAFVSGSYKVEITRYGTEVSGYPALRTLYEQIVNGRSTGQQFFYVQKGRWIIVMSFMTYAENYDEGGPMFAYIVKNFALE